MQVKEQLLQHSRQAALTGLMMTAALCPALLLLRLHFSPAGLRSMKRHATEHIKLPHSPQGLEDRHNNFCGGTWLLLLFYARSASPATRCAPAAPSTA